MYLNIFLVQINPSLRLRTHRNRHHYKLPSGHLDSLHLKKQIEL